jgi:transposase-like protein
MKELETLQDAIVHFSDAKNCLEFMVAMRWPDGVVCPTCGRKDARFLENQRKWQCKSVHHHRQFTVKVGTIFEDSPIPLEKWLPAAWFLINCKNGISSYEVARDLGVTQKTAWFMLHRIRLAMQNGSLVKMGKGDAGVEVDESFIGGLSRNMHLAQRKRRIQGPGGKGKAIAFGILERGGEVRTTVVPDRQLETVHPLIKKHVHHGAALYTDEMTGYRGLTEKYRHQAINHAVAYVDGKIHTNGLENFWSLLKRSIRATYVSIEPFHLFRYLDEQSWRYNNRKLANDGERFTAAMRRIVGKRLTYANLTGEDSVKQKQGSLA